MQYTVAKIAVSVENLYTEKNFKKIVSNIDIFVRYIPENHHFQHQIIAQLI